MKTCSTCKQQLPKSAFYKNTYKNDGLQTYCKKCAHNRRVEYYKENRTKEDARNKVTYAKYRQRFNEYKQTLHCAICGESRWYVLDFHHTSDNKEQAIGTMVSQSARWEKLILEIAKCQVLCSNCHRAYHFENKTWGIGVSV